MLQPVVATSMASTYIGCALPDSVRVCITIVATPAIATAIPNSACFVGARLLKNAQSKINTSTGTDATISAAMPLGMPCCAQRTKPLPMPDSNTPVSAIIGMFTPANGCGLRARNHAYMRRPASAKRATPLMNGGMVCTANAIAR